MRSKAFVSLFITLVFVIQPAGIAAMETDQFNLPPVPLADIGDEVSQHIEQSLFAAVAKINADIAIRQACLEAATVKSAECDSPAEENKKLAHLRSNDAVAKELYKLRVCRAYRSVDELAQVSRVSLTL